MAEDFFERSGMEGLKCVALFCHPKNALNSPPQPALTHENNLQVYQGRRGVSELIFLKDFIKKSDIRSKSNEKTYR